MMLAYMEVPLTTAILKAGDKCKYPLANRPDEYILASDVLSLHMYNLLLVSTTMMPMLGRSRTLRKLVEAGCHLEHFFMVCYSINC